MLLLPAITDEQLMLQSHDIQLLYNSRHVTLSSYKSPTRYITGMSVSHTFGDSALQSRAKRLAIICYYAMGNGANFAAVFYFDIDSHRALTGTLGRVKEINICHWCALDGQTPLYTRPYSTQYKTVYSVHGISRLNRNISNCQITTVHYIMVQYSMVQGWMGTKNNNTLQTLKQNKNSSGLLSGLIQTPTLLSDLTGLLEMFSE